MPEESDSKKQLNTEFVMNQLKGEKFPDSDWGSFLDPDVRDFFDELCLDCGHQRSDIIRKPGYQGPMAIRSWTVRALASETTI